jgi:hypothetical protein
MVRFFDEEIHSYEPWNRHWSCQYQALDRRVCEFVHLDKLTVKVASSRSCAASCMDFLVHSLLTISCVQHGKHGKDAQINRRSKE